MVSSPTRANTDSGSSATVTDAWAETANNHDNTHPDHRRLLLGLIANTSLTTTSRFDLLHAKKTAPGEETAITRDRLCETIPQQISVIVSIYGRLLDVTG